MEIEIKGGSKEMNFLDDLFLSNTKELKTLTFYSLFN